MFDKSACINILLNTDGVLGSEESTTWATSDFIIVDENTEYTMSEAVRICYYDETKTFLSCDDSKSSKTITTPKNCKYVRVMIWTSNVLNSTFMFVLGNSLPSNFVKFEYYIDCAEENIKIKNIDGELDVACTGDSLTYGYGATHGLTDYPSVLAQLTGKTVYNLGVSGEGTHDILARQGGYPAIVNNFIIPTDTTPVAITFEDTVNLGADVTKLLNKESSSLINPVEINGVLGNLTKDSSNVYFTRLTEGDSITINRPTPVITKQMKEHKEDIQIIFIGTNGGWMITSDDAETRINKLTSQIDMMIDYNNSKKYIIIGLHYFYSWILYNGLTKDMLENAMKIKYGRHYINLREYMINYGLDDAGISPTSEDITAIENGEVPPSLLYSDKLHGNDKFYNILANQVYKRGKELNYF